MLEIPTKKIKKKTDSYVLMITKNKFTKAFPIQIKVFGILKVQRADSL